MVVLAVASLGRTSKAGPVVAQRARAFLAAALVEQAEAEAHRDPATLDRSARMAEMMEAGMRRGRVVVAMLGKEVEARSTTLLRAGVDALPTASWMWTCLSVGEKVEMCESRAMRWTCEQFRRAWCHQGGWEMLILLGIRNVQVRQKGS